MAAREPPQTLFFSLSHDFRVLRALGPSHMCRPANGDHNDDSYGLAIYIPSTNDGMHSIKDDYAKVPFAAETSWLDFATAFSNWEGHTWGIE